MTKTQRGIKDTDRQPHGVREQRLVTPGGFLFLLFVFAGVFIFCSNINEPSLVGALLRTVGLYLALQSCCLFIVSEIKKA